MNKIYKLIWSKTKNMYVAVCEFAKSHTKSSKGSIVRKTVTAGFLLSLLTVSNPLYASIETYNGDANPFANLNIITAGSSSLELNQYEESSVMSNFYNSLSNILGVENFSFEIQDAVDNNFQPVYYIFGYEGFGEDSTHKYWKLSSDELENIGLAKYVPKTFVTQQGNYLDNTKDMLDNLYTLDSKIKENSDAISAFGSGAGSVHNLGINNSNEENANYNGQGATGVSAVAIGSNAKATGDESIVISANDRGDYRTEVRTPNSVAIGNENVVAGGVDGNTIETVENFALGTFNKVAGGYNNVFGSYNNVMGNLQRQSSDDEQPFVANPVFRNNIVGNSNSINGDSNLVLGNSIYFSGSNAIIIGNESAGVDNAVSVGSSDNLRAIKYVADGTTATDAATVGQTVELVQGNGITIEEDSTTPTNAIGQKRYRISTIGGLGGGESGGDVTGAVMYDNNDPETEGYHSSVSLQEGIAGQGVKIKNVANGDVTDTSKDAINGSQLYATEQKVASLQGTVDNLSGSVNTMSSTVSDLSSTVNAYSTDISNLNSSVDTLGQSVSTLDTTVGNLTTDVNTLSGNVNTISSGLTPNSNGTYVQTANTVGQNLSALDNAITTTSTTLSSSIGTLSDTVTELGNKIPHYVGINSEDEDNVNYNGGGATGYNAVAIGSNARASGDNSIVISANDAEYSRTEVTSSDSISIGNRNVVADGLDGYNSGNSVVGYENKVAGGYNSVFGTYNNVMGEITEQSSDDEQPFVAESVYRNIVIGNSNTITGSDNIAIGGNITYTGDDAIILGNDSAGVEGAVSVGSSYNLRPIKYVADGSEETDAATVGQTIELVAGNNIQISPDATETNDIGQKRYKISVKNSGSGGPVDTSGLVEYDNNDETSADYHKSVTLVGKTANEGVKLTNVANGTVSADSKDAVTGSQLHATYQYIDNVGTGIGLVRSDLESLSGTVGVLNNSYSTLDGRVTELENTTAGFTSTIEQVNSNIETVNTNIEQVNTTMGQFANDIQQANTNANNALSIANSLSTTVTAISNGLVPAEDGEYVRTNATVGENLTALDTGLKDVNTTVSSLNNTVSGLDNRITDLSSNVASAQSDIENINSNYTTLNSNVSNLSSSMSTLQNQVATGFDVNVNGTKVKSVTPTDNTLNITAGDNITISNDNGSILISAENGGSGSGGTVDTTGFVSYDDNDIESPDYHKKISLNGIDANAPVLITNVAEGTLNATSSDAITGAQLYATNQLLDTTISSMRPSADGNYISTGNSVGQNLTALDTAIKTTSDTLSGQIADINDVLSTIGTGGEGSANPLAVSYDSADKGTITMANARGTKITNVKPALLNRSSMDVVIGSQLWATNQNISGFAHDIAVNNASISTLNTGISNALNAVSVVSSSKADTTLSNLDTMGRNVITSIANEAIDEYMRNNNTNNSNATNGSLMMSRSLNASASPMLLGSTNPNASSDEDAIVTNNDDITLRDTDTISPVIQDALDTKAEISDVEAGFADIHSKLDTKADIDSVYVKDEVDSKLSEKADTTFVNAELNKKADKAEVEKKADKADVEKKANLDASNIDIDAWSATLGKGEISEGNQGLVNGGTVFNALKDVQGNDMITADDGFIRIGGNEKYDNLTAIDVSNSKGESRVITGVQTNPNDATSVANVGYVNAIGDTIIAGVNNGFSKMNDKVNKVGANAAALASLTPASFDGDEKWTLAASVGNYRDATAGAMGLFYRPSEKVLMNVRGSFDGEESLVGGGVAIALDKGTAPGVSKAQLVKEVRDLRAEREQDKARIARLEAMMAEVLREKK